MRTVKSILLHTSTGKTEQLFLEDADDEQRALAVLAAYLPGVAVGATDAHNEQHRRGPQAMRAARRPSPGAQA